MPRRKDAGDSQSRARARIDRTEAYARQVRDEFSDAVNRILALRTRKPDVAGGVMYSFDGDTKKVRGEVTDILRQLHSATVATIRGGIEQEWEAANREVDDIIASAVGRKALSDTRLAGWFDRGEKAMTAFSKRTENGFNLSRRIWQDARQLRDEMEVAMTVAIGEGQSASQIARRVRRYLNDPDLMFRRFRYKDKDGNWQRKWKKRVIGADGKTRFVDCDRDSYRTGTGVYKSAYRNAMRVARTETNMAYRRADHERWSGLDFVLGQRIGLSRSHPKKDICDELAGDYPKDFLFDGWHPQCFCVCTPILAGEEEMNREMEAVLKGEEYTPDYEEVTTYPEGFRRFIDENRERIAASQEAGTAPYFIANNEEVVERIMDGEDGTEENTSTPKTLRHLDEAIERYNYTDPELKEREAEVNAKMKELFENNDYGMDINPENLESIYEKGFLNQFETGTSDGYILPSEKTEGPIETDNKRLVASHRLFHNPDDGSLTLRSGYKDVSTYTGVQYDRSEYEKYGHLLDRDKTRSYTRNVAQYGGPEKVQVRFKKDEVSATWTIADSLGANSEGSYLQPSLTTDPRVESFNRWLENKFGYGRRGYAYQNLDDFLSSKDWDNLSRLKEKSRASYIEIQYHGKLTMDEVESLTFAGDPKDYISEELIGKLSAKGIELWYMEEKNGKRKAKRYRGA